MIEIDLFGGAYRGVRVLITGDTGFKGSWLAIWLQQLGASVYGFGLPPKENRDNFCQCKVGTFVSHQDGDIRDFTSFREYFQKVRPDYAFHLAAQSLVLPSYADPLGTISTNIMGTAHFLECIRESASLKASVVVTSDKCYRNIGRDYAFVEDDPLGGKDPYSASKAACEILTHSYMQSYFTKQSGRPVATARAGNVVGGGDWCQDRLVPDLFRAIQANRPLSIRNPHAVRPWQHVLEAVGGYLLLCARVAQDTSLQGAWNFGPMEENFVSVNQLIHALVSRVGAGDVQINSDGTDREATLLKLNIEKARTMLGWHPVLDFDSTVQFTVEGYTMARHDPLRARIQQIHEYAEILHARVPDWGCPASACG